VEQAQHALPSALIILARDGLLSQPAVCYVDSRPVGGGSQLPTDHCRMRGMRVPVCNPTPHQKARGNVFQDFTMSLELLRGIALELLSTSPWSEPGAGLPLKPPAPANSRVHLEKR